MAILRLENSNIYTRLNDIALALSSLKIQIQYRPIAQNPFIQALLARDTFTEKEKNQILSLFNNQFQEFKRTGGYKWQELMVLHPGSPNLYNIISQCDRYHTHKDAEALYIISGEGIFSLVLPDGRQAEIIVQAGEYIKIPAGVKHWFSLTGLLEMKALRYFSSVDGWVPKYAKTKTCFH